HGVGRQRLPGAVVPGVMGEYLGVPGPDLVDLRGVFDEVPRHVGARDARVACLGDQGVQGVRELVEGGGDLVPGEQGGLPGRGAGDVEVVHHHGELAEQTGGLHQVVHPGAAAFAGAGVVVGHEQAQCGAVVVEDLEDAHVVGVAVQV